MRHETIEVRKAIGNNILEGRLRLGLTQNGFAEIVKLSVQSLSGLENGVKFARMETYCRIAEVLAMPIYGLFTVPRLQDDDFDRQLGLIMCDCDMAEKKALINIIWEIKVILRAKRPL